MQIFHAMKRTDFCKNPQMALKPNMILAVARSESVRRPEKRGEEDGEGSLSVLFAADVCNPG